MDEVQEITQSLTELNTAVKDMTEKRDLEAAEIVKLQEGLAAIQERQRKVERDRVARTSDGGTRLIVPDGEYAGFDLLDVALMRKFAQSQPASSAEHWQAKADEAMKSIIEIATPDAIQASGETHAQTLAARHTHRDVGSGRSIPTGQFNPASRKLLNEFTGDGLRARAAMDSTTSGSGDELVATLQARELWMDVNLQTLVSALIPTSPMPSNPFNIGLQLGDVNFYPGTENVSTTSTAPTTARGTLTAYELVGQVPYSFTLEEDAIIAMLPEIRAGLVRNVAETLDDIILNADTTVTNGINSDGATIAASDAGKGHWLLGYDGLIHLPLVDNTSQANDHNAAVSDDMFNEIRAKLGKYGVRPSELVWITDVNTYIRAQSISNFRTMDKLGPNATLLTGMLGAIEGIPVVVSEQMLLADTDGKVTDSGNGTDTGRLLIVNRTQWRQGFRRELTIDVDRDTQKRQTVATVSFRHALTERSGTRSSATHTALQYDITGV